LQDGLSKTIALGANHEVTSTYLSCEGNCREARTFYGQCLQSDPNFTPFSAGPPEVSGGTTAPDRIIHAELASGPVALMTSDIQPGLPFVLGKNFSISFTCDRVAEMERIFGAVSEAGKVIMPSRSRLGPAC